MKKLSTICAVLLFPLAGHAVNFPEHPVCHAVRVSKAPSVDGDLSDESWKDVPEAGDFTQHDPADGKPASQRTTVKVVYTDEAIYFGAMMFDSSPVTRRLARRDSADLQSDWFRVNLSPQGDGVSGVEFWVSPTNVQVDGILLNDVGDDFSWDAVWSSGTKIIPGVGWSAEFRIPYTQLRFQGKEHQSWGVNYTREILSRHETDRFVNILKGQVGWVSKMAVLTDIDGIRPERTFELVPYVSAQNNLTNHIDRADPFSETHKAGMAAGLDIKYGITSNLMLTGTINPDFGQVEVDPAVVNLSQFETFFPEKRPFFTEGLQIFKFGNGPATNRYNFNFYPPQFFYSRRIGRAPQGTDNLDADFIDAPDQTTILGAGKLTGKFGSGWSIGVLDAVTSRENARTELGGIRGRASVEPAANYFVGRMSKEFSGGRSRVGFLAEQVTRSVPDDLSYLRRSATVMGIDGFSKFHGNDWLVEWQAGLTRVSGSALAIADTQESAAHNYQRPDATYLNFDPTRTSLSGYGGKLLIAKQTGHWMPNIQIQSYSPGFEVGDIGYEQRVDVTNSHAAIVYDNQELTRGARSVNFFLGKYQNWNYGGDLVTNGLYGNWNVTWQNYWYTFGGGGKDWPTLDDRKTRGGPLARQPGDLDFSIGIGSDNRKKIYGELSMERFVADDDTRYTIANLTMTYRPAPSLRVTLSPSYTVEHDASQYVDTVGNDSIFSRLDQHNFQIGTRVEWTLSSTVSFQLYTQPLVATGAYYDFSQLARPRSGEYSPSTYDGNPDFNFGSVRSSAVARWEFRPGSALYVVWSENRAMTRDIGNFHLGPDLAAIRNAPTKDVFLVKVSYWLPR